MKKSSSRNLGNFFEKFFLPSSAAAGQMCCTDTEPVKQLKQPTGDPIYPDFNSLSSPAFPSNWTAGTLVQSVLYREHTAFTSDATHLDTNRHKLHSFASAVRGSKNQQLLLFVLVTGPESDKTGI